MSVVDNFLDSLLQVKEAKTYNPRLFIMYGASGEGKTPLTSDLNLPSREGHVESLARIAERSGRKLLHIDLENPKSTGAIKCNTIHLPERMNYEHFIDKYRKSLEDRIIKFAMEKGNVLLKPDGNHVKEDFNAEKLNVMLNGADKKMVELAEHLWSCVNIMLNNLTEDEMKEVYPFQIAVVDVFTKISDWSEEWAASDYKKTVIGKNFKGENLIKEDDSQSKWLFHREAVKNRVDELMTLFPHLILICHTRDKIVKEGEKEITTKDIDLMGKVSNILFRKADAVAYLYRNAKNIPMINFKRGTENGESKGRCQHLWGMHEALDWSKIYVWNAIEPVSK